jgi:metallo-beta-lactamase class B
MLRKLALAVIRPLGALPAEAAEYTVPFPAHHVIANVYFVGTQGMAVYLITTPAGNILVNSGLEETVEMTKKASRTWASNTPTPRFC